jgi:hypothetical protein
MLSMQTKQEEKERQKKYQRDNKEKIAREAKKYAVRYQRENRERIAKEAKERGIKNKYEKYNMTKQQIDEHKNTIACQVCGRETLICIDHDHNTGKVRGYLCTNCNLALGLVKDSTSILEKMILYLKGCMNG